MARKKKETAEKQPVSVSYRIIPYFAVECDLPAMSGSTGVGATPLKALVAIRSDVARKFPSDRYDISESISNPEFAKGWQMPEPF